MTKIAFDVNENVFLEGSVVFMKSNINVIQGTGYLTSSRFVFCKRSGIISSLLGPLLMHFTKGKDVLFEIKLSDIRRISGSKHGLAKKYTIASANGMEYAVQFVKTDKWLSAFRDAVKIGNPSAKVTTVGDFIEFG